MIYQAIGYRPTFSAGRSFLMAVKRGERTASFNVASAQADWLAQKHPDLTWAVETVGASQQVRR